MKYVILLSVVWLAACSRQGEKRSPVTGNAISFRQIREAILEPYCLACHANNQAPFLNTCEQVKRSLDPIRRTVLVMKTMPKRGELPESEQNLLRDWIDQGAEELPEADLPPAVAERHEVHWPEVRDKIMGPKCAACHFPGNPENVSNLTDVETLRSLIGPTLFLTVASAAMPPPPKGTPAGDPNPNQLTRAERELLSFWVIDGMKD